MISPLAWAPAKKLFALLDSQFFICIYFFNSSFYQFIDFIILFVRLTPPLSLQFRFNPQSPLSRIASMAARALV